MADLVRRKLIAHPIGHGELELFVIKQGQRVFLMIPSESFSIELINGKVEWGYTQLFGHSDVRNEIGEIVQQMLEEI